MRALKGVVLNVDPIARVVYGTTAPFPDQPGAPFAANYYEGTPAVGDPVVIANMDEGSNSWVVIAGTSTTGGVFGVGGDSAITLSRSSTAAAARTTSADANCATGSSILTSATGNFTNADVGSLITATGLTPGMFIQSRNSPTSVNLCHINTAGGVSAQIATITPPIPYTKSGAGATTTFSLQRNLYCTSLNLVGDNGSFLLRTNGYAIFCNELLFMADGITVHNDGFDAVAGTAGVGGPSGFFGGGGNGGAGIGPGVNPGAAGGAVAASIATTLPTSVISGGSGGNPNGPAPALISNAFANGWPASIPQAIQLLSQGGTRFGGGAGGGSGGTSGGVGSLSGAGGGGGGVVGIFARQILNYGTIRCNGGNGAAATLGAAAGAGGGGGGGAGAVVLMFNPAGSNLGQVLALGGGSGGGASGGQVGGLGIQQWVYYVDYSLGYPQARRKLVTVPAGGAGAAGAGTGTAGQAGQAGLVWSIPI